MLLLVAGSVDKQRLFQSLQPLEEEQQEKQRNPIKFQRTTINDCVPLRGVIKREYEYVDGTLSA